MEKNELENEELLAGYHQYLLKRSWQGDFYRKFLLYPKISKRLKGKTIDIGCGTGNFLAFRPNTVGIDVNKYNIDYCKQQGLEAYFVTDTWPFEPETFDSAVLDNVLEHFEEPKPILRQIRDVLKPGGLLVIGVPAPVGFARDSDHKVFYTDEKLKEVVEQEGYTRVENFHMPIRSIFLEKRIKQYCYFAVFLRK